MSKCVVTLGPAQFVDSRIVQLDPAPPGSPAHAELRKTVRILDHSAPAGIVVYTAKISAPDGNDIPGDVKINNALSAAVRGAGPSKWAVLARRDSTLAKLAAAPERPLGVGASFSGPSSDGERGVRAVRRHRRRRPFRGRAAAGQRRSARVERRGGPGQSARRAGRRNGVRRGQSSARRPRGGVLLRSK